MHILYKRTLGQNNEHFMNLNQLDTESTESLHPTPTGCFKANLDTLTGYYDKYTMCTEKIVVELFSVHMEISFHGNKSEKKIVYKVKI